MTAEWLHAADDVEAAAWAITPDRAHFSRAWLAHNERALLKTADYLVLRDSGRPVAVTPFFEVDQDSFPYFAPRALLASYLREAQAPALAELVEQRLGPGALAGLVPAGYVSPLAGTPADRLGEVVREAEAEARRRGLGVIGLLYLEDGDAPALTALADLGYRTTVLDGSHQIAIDPAWRALDAYFAGQPRPTARRRERRRFLDAGYTITWHTELDAALVAAMTPLSYQLYARKGNPIPEDEIRDYFTGLARSLVDMTPLVVTAARNGVAEAFALCFRDRDRLHTYDVGFAEGSDFVYFNILFYEPVAYAIAHGLACVELGLASDAKRQRANRCRRLRGAFRFLDGALDDRWPEISEALDQRYARMAEPGRGP